MIFTFLLFYCVNGVLLKVLGRLPEALTRFFPVALSGPGFPFQVLPRCSASRHPRSGLSTAIPGAASAQYPKNLKEQF